MNKFKCEVCGVTAELTDQEAFNAGWDYPRLMGLPDDVLSPHTCPDCGIDQTVWWELAVNKKSPNALTDKQKSFIVQLQNGSWSE